MEFNQNTVNFIHPQAATNGQLALLECLAGTPVAKAGGIAGRISKHGLMDSRLLIKSG